MLRNSAFTLSLTSSPSINWLIDSAVMAEFVRVRAFRASYG